jgi:hypothetical protein
MPQFSLIFRTVYVHTWGYKNKPQLSAAIGRLFFPHSVQQGMLMPWAFLKIIMSSSSGWASFYTWTLDLGMGRGGGRGHLDVLRRWSIQGRWWRGYDPSFPTNHLYQERGPVLTYLFNYGACTKTEQGGKNKTKNPQDFYCYRSSSCSS